jgi:deoxyribodipyrimidine photo-lyase
MRRILWFRRDLRVNDNPLLSFGGEVLPIFIFDTEILYGLSKGDRRLTFIFHYVLKLKKELLNIGLDLKIFYGKPAEVFDLLLQDNYDEVVASGDDDSYAKQRDLEISHKIHFRYIQDTYIFKHNEVLKNDGSPYLVFTPFYNKARKVLEGKDVVATPTVKHEHLNTSYETITQIKDDQYVQELSLEIESLGFDKSDLMIVDPHEKLVLFKSRMNDYKERRDYLSDDITSHLSIDLRFGTIGVREVLRFLFKHQDLDVEPFIRQLIFRDFYASLLFYMPHIEFENYKYRFNGIEDKDTYQLFCHAQTGVPIIDAGVRELLSTGSMHNRVRMVVASFFTKDLLLPWQWGNSFLHNTYLITIRRVMYYPGSGVQGQGWILSPILECLIPICKVKSLIRMVLILSVMSKNFVLFLQNISIMRIIF